VFVQKLVDAALRGGLGFSDTGLSG